jgi:hypothetical protein
MRRDMNAHLLSRLVAALTPDSALRKAFETPPLLPVVAGRKGQHRRKGQHVRAGYTTSKGCGQSKARRKMARASRHRNRGK